MRSYRFLSNKLLSCFIYFPDILSMINHIHYHLLHFQLLEKQGAERAQQKAQEKSMFFNNMNTGFGRGAGRGAPGRGGGVGPIKGGPYNPGHMRKPYEKPMHAVQQPSPSGPIGARDFATYPEPLIGEL